MALTSERKGGILAQFRRGPADTGSPEVQVALLSERINGLGGLCVTGPWPLDFHFFEVSSCECRQQIVSVRSAFDNHRDR
jgi:hypothetical protein